MGCIDVAIPGVFGVVALLFPRAMLLNDPAPDPAKIATVRICGVVLLAVAGIYFLIKVSQSNP
jgi:hypothetical protein